MSRNLIIGYFGLINNSFLKTIRDKLYIVQDGVFYIRTELVLDAEVRQITENEIEEYLKQRYKHHLMVNRILCMTIACAIFASLMFFVSFGINLLISSVISVVTLFMRRQAIEEWKVRARSIILFVFDYLELLAIYNEQNVAYTEITTDALQVKTLVDELSGDYHHLLRHLKLRYPKIFYEHVKNVELRKLSQDIEVIDYTSSRFKC